MSEISENMVASGLMNDFQHLMCDVGGRGREANG